VGGIGGLAFERLGNQRFDACIVNGPRRAGTRVVMQTLKPERRKPPAPLAHGAGSHSKISCNILALSACRAGQHNPCPHGQRLRRLAP